MERTFGAMLRQLPNQTEVPNLLIDISQTGLAAGLARNVFESDDPGAGEALTAYAVASRARLAAQDFKAVTTRPDWAEIKA